MVSDQRAALSSFFDSSHYSCLRRRLETLRQELAARTTCRCAHTTDFEIYNLLFHASLLDMQHVFDSVQLMQSARVHPLVSW